MILLHKVGAECAIRTRNCGFRVFSVREMGAATFASLEKKSPTDAISRIAGPAQPIQIRLP